MSMSLSNHLLNIYKILETINNHKGASLFKQFGSFFSSPIYKTGKNEKDLIIANSLWLCWI